MHSATTEIYTLSLHDALPIFATTKIDVWGPTIRAQGLARSAYLDVPTVPIHEADIADVVVTSLIENGDRKSTRLNSSHSQISYAVFCLKKKKSTPTPLSSTSH